MPDDTSPLELCLRLTRAQAALTRRLDGSLSALHGLSFNDFTVLHHLRRANGMKLRRIDLAERLGLTASAVTRTLLPLEKLGWVSRESDPRDARVAHAVLTAAGGQLVENAKITADQLSQEALRGFTDSQLDELSFALGRLAGIHAGNG